MKEILVIIAEFLITLLMCVGAGYFLVKKRKTKEDWLVIFVCIVILVTHIFIYLYFDLCFIVNFISSSEFTIVELICLCLFSLLLLVTAGSLFCIEIYSKLKTEEERKRKEKEWKRFQEERKREEERIIAEDVKRFLEELKRGEERKREEELKRFLEERKSGEERKRENTKTNLRFRENIQPRRPIKMQNMMRSKCIYCQGRGFKTHPDGYGGINTVSCPDCFGTGYLT